MTSFHILAFKCIGQYSKIIRKSKYIVFPLGILHFNFWPKEEREVNGRKERGEKIEKEQWRIGEGQGRMDYYCLEDTSGVVF